MHVIKNYFPCRNVHILVSASAEIPYACATVQQQPSTSRMVGIQSYQQKNVTDIQTHTETYNHGIYHASIALCGKKGNQPLPPVPHSGELDQILVVWRLTSETTWQTSLTYNTILILTHWLHGMKMQHCPQNWKYISYRNSCQRRAELWPEHARKNWWKLTLWLPRFVSEQTDS